MERVGAYHVEQILRGQYRQGWRFLTKWEGYGTSESTWEPVRAFVHDDGKLNHVFVDCCLAHAPRFDKALRQARRISSTLKKKSSAEEPNEDTATDNKEQGEVRSKKVSQQRGGKRRRTEGPTVGGLVEEWMPWVTSKRLRRRQYPQVCFHALMLPLAHQVENLQNFTSFCRAVIEVQKILRKAQFKAWKVFHTLFGLHWSMWIFFFPFQHLHSLV